MAKKQSVEDYMADLSHPLKEGVELLRTVIKQANPSLTEQIKWNAPSFGRDFDDRVTLGVRPKCLQVVLHRGVKSPDSNGFSFDDDSGMIKWAAPDRGVITFDSVEEVRQKADQVAEISRRWVEATT